MKKTPKHIVRRFTLRPEQGAAALLVGSTAETQPLVGMTRKGNKVVTIYAHRRT